MYGHLTVNARAVALLIAVSSPAFAAPELITNGNFENWTVNGSPTTQSYIVAGGTTSGSSGATLTGWGNSGYTFLFSPGTASSSGAVATSNSRLNLWGPDGETSSPYYSNNGLTGSPTGGAFLAEDGAYQQGYVYQAVSGLVVGQAYNLSFFWAAAQQAGYTGDSYDGWNVYWADAAYNLQQSFSTATVTTPSMGFTPWRQNAYQVVATQTSMVLGFLATGGPGGVPPFSLLDGVSLQAVPEPASIALLLTGIGLVAGFTYSRRRKQGVDATAR